MDGILFYEFLLTSAFRILFKDTQLRNYLLKIFNILIYDALNAQVFIKTYYLKSLKSTLKKKKSLKSALRALVRR